MRKKLVCLGVGIVLSMQCMSCGKKEARVVSNAEKTQAPTAAATTLAPTTEPTTETTIDPSSEPLTSGVGILEGTAEPTTQPSIEPSAEPTIAATTPEATTAPSTAPVSASNTRISDKWTDMEFFFDGHKYKVPSAYSELKKNGWSFNLADYGYKDGYILNPGDKVTGIIDLKNKKYDKNLSVQVGFVNNTKKAQDIMKCDIFDFSIDTSYAFEKLKNVPEMQIAKGIKIGSSKADVLNTFGKPSTVYDDKEYKYHTYEYEVDYSLYLKITVYDKDGVTAIEYSNYN